MNWQISVPHCRVKEFHPPYLFYHYCYHYYVVNKDFHNENRFSPYYISFIFLMQFGL